MAVKIQVEVWVVTPCSVVVHTIIQRTWLPVSLPTFPVPFTSP